MDNPTLYCKVNNLQTKDAQDVLMENLDLIKWNTHGGDKILDIGCGTGNVTCEVLLPMLPESIKQIKATDINDKMIHTAAKKFSYLKEVEFGLLDIGGDVTENLQGSFDHLFSFFCLHWIKDQRKVMKNIYSLLRPGGDTLFCLVCTAPQIYPVYVEMSNDDRWTKYMTNVNDILLPYENEDNPAEILREHLESAGFNVELCEKQQKQYLFYNDKDLKGFMESINPFVMKMSESERNQFMEHFIDQVKLRDLQRINNRVTRTNYSILVAYAHKPL